MGAKLNRLRNRMRIESEQQSRRSLEISRKHAEATVQIQNAKREQVKLRKTAALTIAIDELPEGFNERGKLYAIRTMFSPEMFYLRAVIGDSYADLSRAADYAAHETAGKVRLALMDFFNEKRGLPSEAAR